MFGHPFYFKREGYRNELVMSAMSLLSLFFWVSLGSPGWPGMRCLDQADLKLT